MHRNFGTTGMHVCDYGAHRRQSETLRLESAQKKSFWALQFLKLGGQIGDVMQSTGWMPRPTISLISEIARGESASTGKTPKPLQGSDQRRTLCNERRCAPTAVFSPVVARQLNLPAEPYLLTGKRAVGHEPSSTDPPKRAAGK